MVILPLRPRSDPTDVRLPFAAVGCNGYQVPERHGDGRVGLSIANVWKSLGIGAVYMGIYRYDRYASTLFTLTHVCHGLFAMASFDFVGGWGWN